uniref:Uncharacterized protein n=1 Tax=Arundo donax TaxID=35708 RepID=A0A0A8Y0L3_ARUDO
MEESDKTSGLTTPWNHKMPLGAAYEMALSVYQRKSGLVT